MFDTHEIFTRNNVYISRSVLQVESFRAAEAFPQSLPLMKLQARLPALATLVKVTDILRRVLPFIHALRNISA